LTLKRRILGYICGVISGLGIAGIICILWMRAILAEFQYRWIYEIPGSELWINSIFNLTVMLLLCLGFVTLVGVSLGFSYIVSKEKHEGDERNAIE